MENSREPSASFSKPSKVQESLLPEEETQSENIFKKWKNQPLKSYIGLYGKDKCQKHEKIYFLKTSKTGSTTIANILMRFGYARPGTNFLLGEASNGHGFFSENFYKIIKCTSRIVSEYFRKKILKRAMFFENGYMPFTLDTCFLGRDIPDRPKMDISYVHMKYNKTAVDEVMHPGMLFLFNINYII